VDYPSPIQAQQEPTNVWGFHPSTINTLPSIEYLYIFPIPHFLLILPISFLLEEIDLQDQGGISIHRETP